VWSRKKSPNGPSSLIIHPKKKAQAVNAIAAKLYLLFFENRDIRKVDPRQSPVRRRNHLARREIFFIVKEGVNNIARHSGCTEVAIILSVQTGSLLLKLRDNGKGFIPSQATEGNGMGSMRERARRLGGKF
jgi:signal transduction histidine kinase